MGGGGGPACKPLERYLIWGAAAPAGSGGSSGTRGRGAKLTVNTNNQSARPISGWRQRSAKAVVRAGGRQVEGGRRVGPDGGRSPEDPDLRRGMGRGGGRGLRTQGPGYRTPTGGGGGEARTWTLARVNLRCAVALEAPSLVAQVWGLRGRIPGGPQLESCGDEGSPALPRAPVERAVSAALLCELPSDSMPQLADRLKAECTVA